MRGLHFFSMSKQLLRSLPELVEAGVINAETADRIRSYYDEQAGTSGSRLFIVFGILGAMLVGMGLILILAHNWDDLPKAIKLAIGFLPLITGQVLAGRILIKQIESRGWRESVGVSLFFAIAVAISIVSQVYNIEGDVGSFLLTWMCLAVPIIYVLGSGMTAMLCIAGITWYGCEVGYFAYGDNPAAMYWILLATVVPYYVFAFVRPQVKNNFYVLISWLLVLSLTTCLGLLSDGIGKLFSIAYASLFSAFVTMGEMDRFRTARVTANSYLSAGSLGVIVLMLFASFREFWSWQGTSYSDATIRLGAVVVIITALIAAAIIFLQAREKGINKVNAKSLTFLYYIVVYFIGMQSPVIAMLLMNLGILFLAIYTIRSGASQNHLGILNYGLAIITALILCRFFDTDLSFVIRGLLFIGVGVGFFTANYYMIKQRRLKS